MKNTFNNEIAQKIWKNPYFSCSFAILFISLWIWCHPAWVPTFLASSSSALYNIMFYEFVYSSWNRIKNEIAKKDGKSCTYYVHTTHTHQIEQKRQIDSSFFLTRTYLFLFFLLRFKAAAFEHKDEISIWLCVCVDFIWFALVRLLHSSLSMAALCMNADMDFVWGDDVNRRIPLCIICVGLSIA